MRLNYSREERQKIVEEYIQSEKSQTVFAPEYGIKPNTLSAWVTKYKSADETENDWKKLLPWNIEITPYKIRGEWI